MSVIPVFPGAFSAWGMLQTDVRHDFKSTLYGFWDQVAAAEIQERLSELELQGSNELVAGGVLKDDISFERAIDFRYHGQEYVLTIALPQGAIDLAKIRASFDDAYARQYGHNNPEARVEMTNLRVAALGKLNRPPAAEPGDAEAAPERTRSVYSQASRFRRRFCNERRSVRTSPSAARPSSKKGRQPPSCRPDGSQRPSPAGTCSSAGWSDRRCVRPPTP